MVREKIISTAAKAFSIYSSLKINQRLYVNAVFALFLAGPLNSFFGKVIFFIPLGFWIAAILYDLLDVYKKIYERVLGKAVLILVFSLCANFAFVMSGQFINDVVGTDPSKFPRTAALLSVFFIPLFVVMGASVMSAALSVLAPILILFHVVADDKAKEFFIPGYSARPSMPYQSFTRLVQFFSAILFCGFIFGTAQVLMPHYDAVLKDVTRSFLFHWEMYPKSPCQVEDGKRVAFLGDSKLLVGERTSTGIQFNTIVCKE